MQSVEQGTLGLAVLPWIPLMSASAGADIIGDWKRLAAKESDARRRSDLAGIALVFAELAGHKVQWQAGLAGWDVMESEIVKAWQAQALKKGEELGRAEGREQGRIEEGRRSLQLVLEARFGRLPKELERQIASLANLRVIDRYLRQAAKIEQLAELTL